MKLKRNETERYFLFLIANLHSTEVDPDKPYIGYLH